MQHYNKHFSLTTQSGFYGDTNSGVSQRLLMPSDPCRHTISFHSVYSHAQLLNRAATEHRYSSCLLHLFGSPASTLTVSSVQSLTHFSSSFYVDVIVAAANADDDAQGFKLLQVLSGECDGVVHHCSHCLI